MARERNNSHRSTSSAALDTEDVSPEPRYVIAAVAARVGVRVQTLRRYEAYGLLEPRRAGSGNRLYSEADIEQVERIRRLINDLGINLAGVAAVLHLRAQLIAAQQELQRLRELRDGR
ncbi:MAG TPA: MerR family transcriptional regulator [Thermomicrobiales bacterium]|nr:MerR family transcriptional regulator [Thermomicrobiales bacterium]